MKKKRKQIKFRPVMNVRFNFVYFVNNVSPLSFFTSLTSFHFLSSSAVVAMQLGRDYIISINDPEPKVNWLCSSSISAISFVSFSGQADHGQLSGEQQHLERQSNDQRGI